jgi:hypothetical protein
LTPCRRFSAVRSSSACARSCSCAAEDAPDTLTPSNRRPASRTSCPAPMERRTVRQTICAGGSIASIVATIVSPRRRCHTWTYGIRRQVSPTPSMAGMRRRSSGFAFLQTSAARRGGGVRESCTPSYAAPPGSGRCDYLGMAMTTTRLS